MTEIHICLSATDIDRIVSFHCTLVAEPYGLDKQFEAQIREGLKAFIKNHNTKKDGVWLAEVQGQLVGTIGIVHESETVARVRWLLVHPDYREKGLEKELLEHALTFCQGNYHKVYLLAATLFERLAPLAIGVGFKKVEERRVVLWGRAVTDERYELELSESIS
jgi:N-acetylglutamate synthase-like GNAT family acetyltransferase